MKKFYVSLNDSVFIVEIIDETTARVNGKECTYELRNTGVGSFLLVLNKKVYSLFDAHENGGTPATLATGIRELSLNSRLYSVTVDDDRSLLLKTLIPSNSSTEREMNICAPMPGLVVRLEVAAGDHVKRGQGLIVLEAMKMENEIKSPGDGVVKTINVGERVAVEKGEELLVIHAH